jgi:hypothetical protein
MAGWGNRASGFRRALRPTGLLLLAAMTTSTTLASSEASAQRTRATRLDFTAVTTETAVAELVQKGQLVRTHLFPTELGGPDDPENVAYVTPQAAQTRKSVIAMFADQFEEGIADRLEVEPDYQGDSLVPTRITLTASHSSKPGRMEMTINIWP